MTQAQVAERITQRALRQWVNTLVVAITRRISRLCQLTITSRLLWSPRLWMAAMRPGEGSTLMKWSLIFSRVCSFFSYIYMYLLIHKQSSHISSISFIFRVLLYFFKIYFLLRKILYVCTFLLFFALYYLSFFENFSYFLIALDLKWKIFA